MDIKVETNGSDGIKNRLNEEDIKRAKAVIITADKKIETARFDGNKVIQRPVSDGIRKADELVERAIKGMQIFSIVRIRQMKTMRKAQTILKVYGKGYMEM